MATIKRQSDRFCCRWSSPCCVSLTPCVCDAGRDSRRDCRINPGAQDQVSSCSHPLDGLPAVLLSMQTFLQPRPPAMALLLLKANVRWPSILAQSFVRNLHQWDCLIDLTVIEAAWRRAVAENTHSLSLSLSFYLGCIESCGSSIVEVMGKLNGSLAKSFNEQHSNGPQEQHPGLQHKAP